MIKRCLWVGVLAMLLAGFSSSALAKGDAKPEWGISGYYHFGAHLAPSNLRGLGVMVHWATPIPDTGDVDFQFRIEGMAGGFWDYESAIEIAIVPVMRVFFLSGSIRPFFEGGIGGSYTTFERHDLGSDFNFLLFLGAGVRWPISQTMTVELGYRYRHLSNAYLGESNQGLNTHVFQVGLVFPF